MISVDIGKGFSVNVDSATVESVTRGRRKGQSQIHIGTVTIEVEEAPASLVKRLRADGGNPAVPERTKPKEPKDAEGEGEGPGDEQGDPGDLGETPPPWDAEDDSLST